MGVKPSDLKKLPIDWRNDLNTTNSATWQNRLSVGRNALAHYNREVVICALAITCNEQPYKIPCNNGCGWETGGKDKKYWGWASYFFKHGLPVGWFESAGHVYFAWKYFAECFLNLCLVVRKRKIYTGFDYAQKWVSSGNPAINKAAGINFNIWYKKVRDSL